MPFSLLPFFILIGGLGLVIVTDLIKPAQERSYLLAASTFSLALAAELYCLLRGKTTEWAPLELVLDFDPMSQVFSCLALFLAFLAVALSKDSFLEENTRSGEYYTMLMAATLGAVLLVHTTELLTFFLAFELLSIPLYVLVGFRRYNRQSAEAGLKYFLSGALSSALFLFGTSWIFGATGTTQYSEILKGVEAGHGQPLILGILFVMAAFGFKLSAAPFHMWAPDTYQGAPIPVAAYLSTVPKVVMLGASVRLLMSLTDHFSEELMLLVAALSVLSIVIGNLVALTQHDMTRLAAYSGVAQIGYLLIGLAALIGLDGMGKFDFTPTVLGSLLFYLIVYTVTNFCFWIVISTVGKARGSTHLDAFDGLSQTSPFLAFALLVSIFSLAGIPPLAGFVGKLYLFRAAFYSQPIMAFFGVLGSVISLYYYFNVLRRCYFHQPSDHQEPIHLNFPTKLFLTTLLLVTLLSGLVPFLTQVCFGLGERILIQ